MSKDYYKTLGIKKDASKDEIKAAYKSLAKKYHPDISKESNAEQKFKEISEAYAVLGDDKKREQYDTFGSDQFGQRYSTEDIFRGFDFSDLDDLFNGFGGGIFETFFGGGGQRRRKQDFRGDDLRFDLTLTFEEAAFGTTKEILVKKLESCRSCDGTGAEGRKFETCDKCGGSGQVRRTSRTPFGAFTQITTCPSCRGVGKSAENPCGHCNGSGRSEEKKKISVRIPAGVDEGSQLRVPHEGEAGLRGGRSGDLYIFIHVKPSELFERRGSDLYLELPITFSQAALGDEISIPTLEKEVKLKIKPGTQSETHYKLSGKGIPYTDGYGKGDMYVVVKLVTPAKLSREQRDLLEKLRKTEAKKSILERIKEFTSK